MAQKESSRESSKGKKEKKGKKAYETHWIRPCRTGENGRDFEKKTAVENLQNEIGKKEGGRKGAFQSVAVRRVPAKHKKKGVASCLKEEERGKGRGSRKNGF